jgi:hypothetical protein
VIGAAVPAPEGSFFLEVDLISDRPRTKCYPADVSQQPLYRETEGGNDRRGHRGKLTADDPGHFDHEA